MRGTEPHKKKCRKSGIKRRAKSGWRHYLTIGFAVLLAALLVAGVWYVERRSHHPEVSVAKAEYPIQGIDVSNHNGVIDFEKVAAAGINFVYVKASEGVGYKDPRFENNIRNARKAGLKVGAYHFFRKDKDGTSQAEYFMQVVKDVAVDMPYVIDVEDWGNSMLASDDETVKNLRDMVRHLETSNLKLMVYTNKDGYRKYLKLYFPEVRLWLCAFTHPSKLTDFDWHIHQYSHWGEVDGIDGEVDLDVFKGNCEEWERWLME